MKTKLHKPEPIKSEDIATQIEKFFKEGNTITKVPNGHRAMPEFTWWKETYPKNLRRK
jgi:hypothetical protein|tara:strand:- start:319 stop:492 length:174 start_codon:yes stop_codon:yes gene_type:complete